jgi:hypothetical protein
MDGYADAMLTVAEERASAGDAAGADSVLRLTLRSAAPMARAWAPVLQCIGGMLDQWASGNTR